jgi:hypothetical protein
MHTRPSTGAVISREDPKRLVGELGSAGTLDSLMVLLVLLVIVEIHIGAMVWVGGLRRALWAMGRSPADSHPWPAGIGSNSKLQDPFAVVRDLSGRGCARVLSDSQHGAAIEGKRLTSKPTGGRVSSISKG